MINGSKQVHARAVVGREDLQKLLDAIRQEGFALVGPSIRDGAIAYERVERVEDLPVGWTDEQEGGRYRLKRREDDAVFGYVVGPASWKQFLHPPQVTLWRAIRRAKGFDVIADPFHPQRNAFLAVRPCDIRALEILDRVFMNPQFCASNYRQRRENLLIVAVNCGQAARTCFCTSMGSGPKAEGGFDLCLTEILEGGHRFLVEVGSEAGQRVMARTPWREPTEQDEAAAAACTAKAASQIVRHVDVEGIKELLFRNVESAVWDEVATRCLCCANCTMVCPTCFCNTLEDVTDLTGNTTTRRRRWDSCFTSDFTYIHGGSVRLSPMSRYRQWATHKLGAWIDQFGTSGCVGCGRCIAWCPVGIDITEEVRAIRASDVGETSQT